MSTPPICAIVPPHLLRRLARQEVDPDVARAAKRTLSVTRRVTDKRELRAERPRRTPGATFLPHDRVRPAPATKSVPSRTAKPDRTIHDAAQSTKLPGKIVRREGAPAVTDGSVNQAYDGLGDTWSLYWEVFGRDSLDDDGLPLVATVHFDKQFDNAYWDGEQMVFGDGDGVYFQDFTGCVDVIGHELAHGVTQFTAGLTYVGQSGALNESISDCFGSMVKQRVLGQSATEGDWLIGQGLFTPKVKGVALRSMKAPGTAYDDPELGKDPQPGHMRDYVEMPHDEANDNGGVHINSGIPNRAFYLAATSIGGNTWEGAGAIWYHTLTQGGLAKDVDFAAFAQATIAAAGAVFADQPDVARDVDQAWRDVGVLTG